jgi:hypothetical protein
MKTRRRVVRVACSNVIPQEQSGAVFHSPQSDRGVRSLRLALGAYDKRTGQTNGLD